MATEDDTFQALRKQPWDVVRERVLAVSNDNWQAMTEAGQTKFFYEMGWTYSEYIREYIKRGKYGI